MQRCHVYKWWHRHKWQDLTCLDGHEQSEDKELRHADADDDADADADADPDADDQTMKLSPSVTLFIQARSYARGLYWWWPVYEFMSLTTSHTPVGRFTRKPIDGYIAYENLSTFMLKVNDEDQWFCRTTCGIVKTNDAVFNMLS